MDKFEKNIKNMQKFYNEISEKYDDIFPLNNMQKDFFYNILENSKKEYEDRSFSEFKILDVGASTGNLSSHLKENLKEKFEGNEQNVFSIDINEKLIEKANQKGIIVKNMNMLDIDKLNENFDLIINIGNTLPHLHSKEEVEIFFEKSYISLKNNGKLIIQMINFNKFLVNKKENENYLGELPLIENKNVKFERFYYVDEDNNIIFKTILDNEFQNEEVLLNINFHNLKKYLENIGFRDIEVYGGFNKSEFDFENSLFLVIVCTK